MTQPTKSRKKYLLLGMLIICVAAGLIWWKLPTYQDVIANKVKVFLAGYGLDATSLDVTSVSNTGAALANISIGRTEPLEIDKLSATYKAQEFLKGHINSLTADGVTINAYKENGVWLVHGLEALLAPKEAATPLDIDALRLQLPKQISLQNMHINAVDGTLKLEAPLNLSAAMQPQATATIEGSLAVSDTLWDLHAPITGDLTFDKEILTHLKSNSVEVNVKPYKFSITGMDTTTKLSQSFESISGSITAKKLLVQGFDYDIPPLSLKADFSYLNKTLKTTLNLKDAKNTHSADLALSLPTSQPTKGTLTIKAAHFPWGGGVISTKNLIIPLALNKPIALDITLKNVELASLLGDISSGRISGTGKISGTVPLTYYPDGKIVLRQGEVNAMEIGLIAVSPDLLPGDNAQLALARSTLENFHYTSLKIQLSSDENNKSAIRLLLEGKNPNAADARLVKLNVQLGGDILPLIQQSIIPMNDIKELLKLR